MGFWLTTLDGSISFMSRASTADAALLELARKYDKPSFAAWLEAAGYSAAEIQIAEMIDQRQTGGHDVEIVGPPVGMVESAFLQMRAALK